MKSLDANIVGHHQYLIAAADTVMRMSNEELVKKCFPTTIWERKDGDGPRDTLLSIDKARRELGYNPEYKWEECVEALKQVK